jgi:hypothetical protein
MDSHRLTKLAQKEEALMVSSQLSLAARRCCSRSRCTSEMSSDNMKRDTEEPFSDFFARACRERKREEKKTQIHI